MKLIMELYHLMRNRPIYIRRIRIWETVINADVRVHAHANVAVSKSAVLLAL